MPYYAKCAKRACGANADTIVTRNFLRAVASGGCYIHIVENTARNLKDTAKTKGELKGIRALHRLGELFEITEADDYVLAEKVADAVLQDLYKPEYEKMELVLKMGYAPRLKKWKSWNSRRSKI